MDNLQPFSSEATTWEAFIKEEDIDIKLRGGHTSHTGVTLRDQHSRAKDLRNESIDEEEDSSQKLPRNDVALYGIYPKIDGRVLSLCVGCKGVFHPQHIKEHTCTNRSKSSIPQNLKKKVKSKKKSQASPVPPPPIFQEQPVSPTTSTNTPEVPLISELDKINSTLDPFETEPVVSSTVPTQIIATTVDVAPSSPPAVSTTTTTITTTVVTSSIEETASATTSIVTLANSSSPLTVSSGNASSSTSSSSNSTSNSNSSSNSSSSSSSRHKKSKKNKIPKEYNADVHCGVVDSKGICMRSITCSNHRIQQRKLVLGRSKDIHQLIAEKKAAKEKEGPLPNDEKELNRQDVYVPLLTTATNDKDIGKKHNSYIPILPKTESDSTLQTKVTTSTALSIPLVLLQTNYPNPCFMTLGYVTNMSRIPPSSSPFNDESSVVQDVATDSKFIEHKNIDDGYHTSNSSQEVATNSPHVPVVYMPMSPVSVVSPVQLVQIGNNMVCIESPQPALSPPLPNQSFLWKIPDQIGNLKIYKSHPKPAALPMFGAKKIGGAVILSNQRLESQYNDIQVAIATKRKASNNATNYKAVSLLNNTPHRPNILKVKNKNCKRPSTDKIISGDSKQIRLTPDVNGFILHSDMSEGAEAPQTNNSIQEKIALLNMK